MNTHRLPKLVMPKLDHLTLLLILGLAFSFRTVWSYPVIFILICFLPAIHAPSAICPIIVLIPYILLNLKGNFKHSLGIALALILLFLVIFPWIFDMLLPAAKSLLTQSPPTLYVQLPRLIQTYGYLPILSPSPGLFRAGDTGWQEELCLTTGLTGFTANAGYLFHLSPRILIIYTRESCNNPDLMEAGKNIYLLKEAKTGK